jgi:hypothetical protein
MREEIDRVIASSYQNAEPSATEEAKTAIVSLGKSDEEPKKRKIRS